MARSSGIDGGSQTDLREANERRILTTLAASAPLSQAQVARQTGLAASTVSNIVNDLIERQLVVREAGLGGPHGTQLTLNPSAGIVLGIEMGHRHLTIALADLSHRVIASERTELKGNHHWEADLPLLNDRLNRCVRQAGVKRSDILTAGLALPAPIDLEGRTITSPDVMPGWAGIDIRARASEALKLPVYVDNDANLGAMGEHSWGAAQGVDDLIYLKVADGIGAGLVLGGEVYRGADGSAGEIGHVTIVDKGRMCRCGNRGCLETVASVPAILELVRPILGASTTIEDVIEGADHGHAACRRVLSDAGRDIGIALANAANTLNPRLIVLGGTLAQASEHLLPSLRAAIGRYGVPSAAERLEFRTSSLGLRSHVLGALTLALFHAPQIS